ncbi:MAG: hypothetical protein QF807_00270 [Candidatus Thalassarchaeaceae archaeon]|nr:hypothetical protein [Candidatus Thalassarchaeaceae archaeon]MDP7042441.1 hypothetical protein [Candidatus Thalassarchaeaceae archaeon]
MGNMEWHPITIEKGEKRDTQVGDKRPSEGLSANPESLHQNFLSNLGHLQEIHDSHQNMMGAQFSSIESNFERVAGVLSTEAMLDRFDGKTDDDHISLPLHGCELSGVQLNICEIAGDSIVKLNVTGRDGAELEQAFSLPAGSRLANATWNAGELHLTLSR